MTGYPKRLFRAAAVALAAAGVGLVSLQAPASATPSTASARPASVQPAVGATAWLEKSQFLAKVPNSGMAQSCISKPIYLATNTYEFAAFAAGYVVPPVDYTIPAGTWQWTACITPLDGFYNLDSNLVSSQGSFDVSGPWLNHADGVGLWGSYLKPLS
jgi:hypothetical protein